MTDPGDIRVGDRERREVDALLQKALAEGVLTLAEYDERSAGCWAARTRRDLDPLTADLPDLPDSDVPARAENDAQASSQPGPTLGARLAGAAVPTAFALGVALLGGHALTSDDGVAVFGERVVQVSEDQQQVQVGVLFGGVEVVVPDNVRARTEGMLVFGGVECREACGGPGEREVVIDTRGGFGGVEILSPQEFQRGVDLDDVDDEDD